MPPTEQTNLQHAVLLLMWNDFQQNDYAELERHDRRLAGYRAPDVLFVLHRLEQAKFIEGDRFGDGGTFRLTVAGRLKARALAATKMAALWALASLF